jgi:plastocyanin domain-containing protein
MSLAAWTVNLLALAAIAWIVWYFWLSRTKGVTAQEADGVQHVAITVKGGYDPDTIVVKRGHPVRLTFTRRESSMCSETVVLDKIGQSRTLPENEAVEVEFTPTEAGEIPFQCQMGMLRGVIVVTA